MRSVDILLIAASFLVLCGCTKPPAPANPVNSPAPVVGEPWQRILLEDKVFTPIQIETLERLGRAIGLTMDNFHERFFFIGVTGNKETPDPLIDINFVIGQYGKADEVRTEKDEDHYRWGPIELGTKKGESTVISFGAYGRFYLDGLKESARKPFEKPKQPSANRVFAGKPMLGGQLQDADGKNPRDIAVFADDTRTTFPSAKSADMLKAIADDHNELGIILRILAGHGETLKVGGKKVSEVILIAAYPKKGALDATKTTMFGHPTGFIPGKVTKLSELSERFGKATETELWSIPGAKEIGLDGVVHWWGDVGVAANSNDQVSHVLVRQAPPKPLDLNPPKK